jgi:hypothetical protein
MIRANSATALLSECHSERPQGAKNLGYVGRTTLMHVEILRRSQTALAPQNDRGGCNTDICCVPAWIEETQ